jgi:hypothetical protein
LYVKRTEEVLETQAVQQGAFSIELSLKFSQAQGLTTMSREPNEELLRSFLLTFRQFVSEKEPVFVNAIANILWKNLRSDELRGMLEDTREQWRQACRQGPMRVIIDDEHLTPADALDLWINGKYFHSDKRKVERIDRLDPMKTLLARHVFLNHIISGMNYVMFLGQVIVVARRNGLLS